MTALITGISGFLAGRLARALTASGDTVVGVGRRAPEGLGVAYVPLDLADPTAVRAAVAAAAPERVFHLAAVSTISGADGPTAALTANVLGTAHVLDACRDAGVRAVVVASSDKQYGALAAPPYDDSDATAFLNGGVYELSKAQQDQVARLFSGLYDTPAVRVARLVNLYGPGDTQWTRIVPGTIRRTVEGVAPRVTSGKAGAALREYLFVDDAVAALLALAADAIATGNAPHWRIDGRLARVAFNVGSPHRHAAAGVIATVQQVLRDDFGIVGPPPEAQPAPGGAFEPGDQCTSTARLAALLGRWEPRSLADGLRATIPWYLAALGR